MTLDTRVYIIDEIDPLEVFKRCNEMLRAPESVQTKTKQTGRWNKGKEVVEQDDPWMTFNVPGQGLPALLDVRYRKSGPLRTQEQHEAHEEFCNIPGNDYYDEDAERCDGAHASRPACWMEVSFDTAYGYRTPEGVGCGELHANLLRELGHWLTAAGIDWKWRNEFTGDIWDRFEHLVDLVGGGERATAWFESEAMPAIEAHAAEAMAEARPMDLGVEGIIQGGSQ